MRGNGVFTIRCAAKINLYLGVLGVRADGYHEIETLFQPVSLYDGISFSRIDKGIELFGSDENIKWDESNLCYRAAEELFKYVNFDGGVRIEVEKNIPVGAGLGGGSSDAGGVITGLNKYLNFGLSYDKCMEIALRIGSDVPFFVFGRPAVGRGRGELLEAVDGIGECFIVLAVPSVRISTEKAFKNLSLMLTRSESEYKLRRLLDRLNRFPGSEIETYNSFAVPMQGFYPEVRAVLDLLKMEKDCVFSSLSGSGSACFSVFVENASALRTLGHVRSKGYFGMVVKPVKGTIDIGNG
ncbi:4-(cytidine 5'-diphospho)-2-C-methyl-D-erythritol kinase [bacterium]|nr:4-(cytidine 5'-diphospho)-2-C-methyl-D-erythritol kinase [bacterium]